MLAAVGEEKVLTGQQVPDRLRDQDLTWPCLRSGPGGDNSVYSASVDSYLEITSNLPRACRASRRPKDLDRDDMRKVRAHGGAYLRADRQVRSTWGRYPGADVVGMAIVQGDLPFVHFHDGSFSRLWASEQVTAAETHADYPVDQLYKRD